MAQTLQKMIFNDQNDFTHVLVAHYCKLEYSNIFLRCVNDIDQELKVKSSKLKVAILTTYNFKLITLKNLRRLWRWGPPLPIPNRAVKTTSADGTRVKPGRVSRCPNFFKTLMSNRQGFSFLKRFKIKTCIAEQNFSWPALKTT